MLSRFDRSITNPSQAHINVEACMSVKSVKYLNKYIYKGHDYIELEFKEIQP